LPADGYVETELFPIPGSSSSCCSASSPVLLILPILIRFLLDYPRRFRVKPRRNGSPTTGLFGALEKEPAGLIWLAAPAQPAVMPRVRLELVLLDYFLRKLANVGQPF